jgi:glutamate synthase (NADPH/NADH) small chain
MSEVKKSAASRPGRTSMPEQEPAVRRRNFQEVPHGYSEEQAVAEAQRCLQCKRPQCVEGCPVNVKIPEFIKLIAEKRFAEAAPKIKETNSLPAVCGRVCPQESQCECKCIVGKKAEPVAIGNLERFAADWEMKHGSPALPQLKPANGKKIAVIGTGPAGLTVAGEMIKEGFEVTMFEALHETGGVLVYGIPEFRLPKRIVKAEIEYLLKLGVKLEKNVIVGKTITIDELMQHEGYHAVFVGTGAGLPSFMSIPGENAVGVYSANGPSVRSSSIGAPKTRCRRVSLKFIMPSKRASNSTCCATRWRSWPTKKAG